MSTHGLSSVPQSTDTAVTYLILRENNLTALDASSVYIFAKLKKLDLNYLSVAIYLRRDFRPTRETRNALQQIQQYSLSTSWFWTPVNSLLRIDMSHAFIEDYDLHPYYFSAFKKLKRLVWGGKYLTFSKFHIPDSLTSITLYDMFEIFPDFSNVNQLTYLDFCYNKFSDIPNEYIQGLDSVMYFSACYTNLDVIPGLSHMKNLNQLRFQENSISRILRNIFNGLTKLRQFRVRGNQITAMPNISYLPLLKKVLLENNRISYVPTPIWITLTCLGIWYRMQRICNTLWGAAYF